MINDNQIEIYTSRDKIRDQLINLAKDYLQLENFDFNKSSYLSYIINMLSVLDANLLYYISSVYREQFLTKAMQRESVLNLSSMIGYKPPLAEPATCKVLIDIPYDSTSPYSRVIELVGRNHDNSTDEDIEKPIFKVYSTDAIEFSLINTCLVEIEPSTGIRVREQVFLSSSTTLSSGWKTIDHRVVNGRIQFFLNFIQLVDKTETFVIPELLPNEFHNIDYRFQKSGSIADVDLFLVSTNTNSVLERWARKDSIYGIGPDEPAYTYREKDNGISISFGNGVIGRQPKKGSEVIITIGLTRGYAGNIIAGNIKRSDAVRMVVDVSGTSKIQHINVRVVNKEPSQFGKDAPTIDEIRSNAINRISTNSRLVSHRDFENADLVVKNLPIRNVFQVLKRSDLKRNEITLFTELIYNNVVVPTRNASIDIVTGDDTGLDEWPSDQETYQIKADTVYSIDNEEYITLFDTYLNRYTLESTYYYYLNEVQTPLTIKRTIQDLNPTKILPIFASFTTDRTSDPENEVLDIELHCNVIDTTTPYKAFVFVDLPLLNGVQFFPLYDYTSGLIDNLTNVKIFSTKRDPRTVDLLAYMNQEDVDTLTYDEVYAINNGITEADLIELGGLYSQYNELYIHRNAITPSSISLSDIPDGKSIEFAFQVAIDETPGGYELNYSTCNIVIKRDLSDFMYSQINTVENGFKVADIPLIRKDYYDNLLNKSLFTSAVLQKLIDFNVFEYKMVTDFVNLKFANTTGKSTNMQFNDTNKSAVWDVNPSEEDILTYGNGDRIPNIRYAVSDSHNVWQLKYDQGIWPLKPPEGGGFITWWGGGTDSNWKFETLKINDFFEVTHKDGVNVIINNSTYEELEESDVDYVPTQKMIYTGNDIVVPEFDIPLELKLTVIPSSALTTTDQVLVKSIKDKLVLELSPKFGYNKSIKRSEIVSIVQSVPGVDHVEINYPKYNILFQADPYKNMTQAELIDYTPELVFFSTDNIIIELKE